VYDLCRLIRKIPGILHESGKRRKGHEGKVNLPGYNGLISAQIIMGTRKNKSPLCITVPVGAESNGREKERWHLRKGPHRETMDGRCRAEKKSAGLAI